jgi:hypothetical protein
MPSRSLATAGLLTVLLATACASVSPMLSAPSSSLEGSRASPPAERRSSVADAVGGASPPAAVAASGQAAAQAVLPGLDRMIIRTHNMTLVVAKVGDAYRLVERIAAEHGGLVAGSQVRQDGDHTCTRRRT